MTTAQKLHKAISTIGGAIREKLSFEDQQELANEMNAERRYQSTIGRCTVWNEHFKFCKTKMIVSYSPAVYAYVASDGSMWMKAERVTTSRAKLACIWASKRGSREPVKKWGVIPKWTE